MGNFGRFRPTIISIALLGLALLPGLKEQAFAAHDLGLDCYTCHNVKGGTTWPNSYSIYSGTSIGMPSYTRPITCEICHTDYGANRFSAASPSHHPVQIITSNTMATDNWTTKVILCKDCHNGNVTILSPDLSPDVSPYSYATMVDNATDGYPNHDNTIPGYNIVAGLWSNQNFFTAGTEPHLSASYTHAPSATPVTAYALCLSCHDGSNKTARMDNILRDYTVGTGHYYKTTAPVGGGALNDKLACSDCHASHNSTSSSRLLQIPNPANNGYVPITISAIPTAAQIRTVCNACHVQIALKGTPPTAGTTPLVRGVRPMVRPDSVLAHALADTTSCYVCHLGGAHDPVASCNGCHGDAAGGSNGAPPGAPFASFPWASRASVDCTAVPAGIGDHRVIPLTAIDCSSHTSFLCDECHTVGSGSDALHNKGSKPNASMTNITPLHNWPSGPAAVWSPGPNAGATLTTGSVVDDSCNNINCHSPSYSANAGKSGTPFPYNRYWVNKTLWDCYTCHAYDGRTVTTRPATGTKTDNTMSTGSHTFHVDNTQLACTECHPNNAGNLIHKTGFVNITFVGAPLSPSGKYDNLVAMPPTDNGAANRKYTTCANVYCHSNVQNQALKTGWTASNPKPTWGSPTTGNCGTCHGGDGVTDNAASLMATGSHPTHVNRSNYRIDCVACHTGSGTNTPKHADGRIDVALSGTWTYGAAGRNITVNGLFDNTQVASSITIDNQYAVVGADNAYGQCSNNTCHSDGRTGVPRVNPPKWGATDPNCIYCHAGNASSTAPFAPGAYAGDNSHYAHVVSSSYNCRKCHYGTVNTTDDRLITGYDNHVNGTPTVMFAPEVGGTYNVGSKQCSATSCHGTPTTLPDWDNGATVAGKCSSCHSDMGPGLAFGFTGSHRTHTDNGLAGSTAGYKNACEVCHAWANTGSGANRTKGVHVDGDNNAATPRTVQISFSDCTAAGSTFVYNTRSYYGANMFANPYGVAAPSPTYTDIATAGAPDPIGAMTWSLGSCNTVWCHSNASPVAFEGGAVANAYRTPQWGQVYGCTVCHTGVGTRVAMSSGTDNLSKAHITHVTSGAVADNGYAFTCDKCHAMTSYLDCTVAIAAGTGFDNHVNGVKNVKFSTTIRAGLTLDQSAGAYNSVNRRCSAIYCHSNGTDNTSFGAQFPNDNLISWDNALGTTCKSCHGGNTVSGKPIATGSHTKHIATYKCADCHSATVAAGTDNSLALTAYGANGKHVNGYKDVVAGGGYIFNYFDNSTFGSCTNISCHGGNTAQWGATLTCFDCHAGAELTSKPSQTGTAASPVNSAEYASAGHGRPAGSNYPLTGNPPAHFDNMAGTADCYYCHSQSSGHVPTDNTNDPYRLNGSGQKIGGAVGSWADNTDGLCLTCHGAGASVTFRATKATSMLGHTKANAGSKIGAWTFTPKCVDCHDPHGDTNNVMIRSGINAPIAVGDNSATGAGSNSKGTPNRTTNITAVTFTDNTGFKLNSFANPGVGSWGICEVCHVQTSAYSRTLDNTAAHASTQTCTNCHSHTGGFKGSGSCMGCHNVSNLGAATPGNPVALFSSTRSHVVGVKDSDCSVCHHSTQSMPGAIPNTIILRNADNGAPISYAQGNLATSRLAINTFCLACHDTAGATYTTDGFVGGALGTSPTKPFSDCSSIIDISKFWKNTTWLSHNYAPATNNTLPQMTKAASPHGFPTLNKLKEESGTASLGQTKYTDAQPVSCLECHPAHGGNITSPTKLKGAAFVNDPTFVGGKMINSAEPGICWNCHDTTTPYKVQDYWGDNSAGAHWTGTLKSTFGYQNGKPSLSSHQVNDNTQPIACSICHNPHGASVTAQFNSPMLRGTWMTSPYLQDRLGMLSGAATTGLPSSTLSSLGPRMLSTFAYNKPKGRGNGFDNGTGTGQDGYFIDENTFGVSGTMAGTWLPTAVTANHIIENTATFGGLCATCHTDATYTGTGGMASMQSFLTSGILKGGQGKTGWGTGAQIHNTVRGWANGGGGTGATVDVVNPTNNPYMHGYPNAGASFCFAGDIARTWAPFSGYNWQAVPSTVNQMTGATAIHQFPCSKCHTPHATNLPRLMVTNCLDVGSTTTYRKAHGGQALWNYPTTKGAAHAGFSPTQALSMTCHNKNKANNPTGGGWNKVTGW